MNNQKITTFKTTSKPKSGRKKNVTVTEKIIQAPLPQRAFRGRRRVNNEISTLKQDLAMQGPQMFPKERRVAGPNSTMVRKKEMWGSVGPGLNAFVFAPSKSKPPLPYADYIASSFGSQRLVSCLVRFQSSSPSTLAGLVSAGVDYNAASTVKDVEGIAGLGNYQSGRVYKDFSFRINVREAMKGKTKLSTVSKDTSDYESVAFVFYIFNPEDQVIGNVNVEWHLQFFSPDLSAATSSSRVLNQSQITSVNAGLPHLPQILPSSATADNEDTGKAIDPVDLNAHMEDGSGEKDSFNIHGLEKGDAISVVTSPQVMSVGGVLTYNANQPEIVFTQNGKRLPPGMIVPRSTAPSIRNKSGRSLKIAPYNSFVKGGKLSVNSSLSDAEAAHALNGVDLLGIIYDVVEQIPVLGPVAVNIAKQVLGVDTLSADEEQPLLTNISSVALGELVEVDVSSQAINNTEDYAPVCTALNYVTNAQGQNGVRRFAMGISDQPIIVRFSFGSVFETSKELAGNITEIVANTTEFKLFVSISGYNEGIADVRVGDILSIANIAPYIPNAVQTVGLSGASGFTSIYNNSQLQLVVVNDSFKLSESLGTGNYLQYPFNPNFWPESVLNEERAAQGFLTISRVGCARREDTAPIPAEQLSKSVQKVRYY